MEIVFDPVKDAANIAKHGLSFSQFTGFDTKPAVRLDARYDYGEARYRAFGRIDGLGYCLVYLPIAGVIRAISFRRAHDKEMKRYE